MNHDPTNSPANDRICVGALAGAFGVKGEVRVKSFCADPEAIGDYGTLWSEDGRMSFNLTLNRPIKNGFSARIEGVDTKEKVDELQGVKLFADRKSLPQLPDDEFYHSDLVGLSVFDTGGREIGHVFAVLNHGAGDVLDIHGPDLKDGALLPFTLDAVPTVDLKSGRIIIDPPGGIFPE